MVTQSLAGLSGHGLAGDDKVVPFHVAPLEVRGRAVQLGPALDRILKRHAYPAPVSRLLGEMAVLTVLLGTSLKFDGRFIVQTQTDGPVSLLVVELRTPGNIRAYANFDAEALEQAEAEGRLLPEQLLGSGILAMTIDQGKHTQRYQGIVALDGSTLEAVARSYFRQSEQIPTETRIAVGEALVPAGDGKGSVHAWRAGGVLIQFLPENEARLTVRDLPGGDAPKGSAVPVVEERNELWLEARTLLETVADDELTDPSVGSERLLYRLFHERGVHVFDGPAVADKCSCSRERIVGILSSLPEEDIRDSLEDGQIVSRCEFCGVTYHVAPAELRGIRGD